jgi:hypothetical protein
MKNYLLIWDISFIKCKSKLSLITFSFIVILFSLVLVKYFIILIIGNSNNRVIL